MCLAATHSGARHGGLSARRIDCGDPSIREGRVREFWLRVRALARAARRVKRYSGAGTIVRVQKRTATPEDVARATQRVMRDHRAALEWLADK